MGASESPALQGSKLRDNFDLTLAEVTLDDVVRQELDSAILSNAHDLRMRMAVTDAHNPAPFRGLKLAQDSTGCQGMSWKTC